MRDGIIKAVGSTLIGATLPEKYIKCKKINCIFIKRINKLLIMIHINLIFINVI